MTGIIQKILPREERLAPGTSIELVLMGGWVIGDGGTGQTWAGRVTGRSSTCRSAVISVS